MPAIAAFVELSCSTCFWFEPVSDRLNVTPSPLPEERPVAVPGLTLSYSWRLGNPETAEVKRFEHVPFPPSGTSTGTRPDGTAAGGMRSPEFDASAGRTTNNVNPDDRYESGRQPGHRPLAPQNVHPRSPPVAPVFIHQEERLSPGHRRRRVQTFRAFA